MAVFVAVLVLCFIDYGVCKAANFQENEIEDECRCVPQHLCMDNDVAVSGQGLFDIRYEASQCPNYFDVCCDNPAPPTNSSKSKEYKGCGYQGDVPTTRITGDMLTAQFGELPWTLALLSREPETERMKYKCGGSLIHPQVALTAAHCVSGSEDQELTVRAGEWDTKSQNEPIPHQDVVVQEVVVHPAYNAPSLKNDIALLFLAQPLSLADNVGIVCLPSPKMSTDDRCIACGWGKDAYKKGRHSSVLKKVELPLVARAKCVEALRKTRLGAFYKLHRSFICAGGEDSKDTCKGDGGSPLVCKIPGHGYRYAQVGIVAWGIGCGESQIPGVYVNVALYRSWIDKEMASRELDASYYSYN